MNKKLSIISGFFAILLTFSLFLPKLVTLNGYRANIESKAFDAIGRKVHINGDIKLSLLPYPGLTLKNIRVENASWGTAPYFIQADEAAVSVALFSLMMGSIDISQISLIKPIIHLESSKNGQHNWLRDKLPGAGTSTTAQTFKSDIPRINVREGQIKYFAKNGGYYKIDHLQTSLKVNSSRGPFIADGHLEVNGRQLEYKLFIDDYKPRKHAKLDLSVFTMNHRVQLKGGFNIERQELTGNLAAKLKKSAKLFLPEDMTLTGEVNASPHSLNIEKLAATSDSLNTSGHVRLSYDKNLNFDIDVKDFPGHTHILSKGHFQDFMPSGHVKISSNDFQHLLGHIWPEYAGKINLEKLAVTGDFETINDILHVKNAHLNLDEANIKGSGRLENNQTHFKATVNDAQKLLTVLGLKKQKLEIDDLRVSGVLTHGEIIKINAKAEFEKGFIETKGHYAPRAKTFDIKLNTENNLFSLYPFLNAKNHKADKVNLKLSAYGSHESISINKMIGSFKIDGKTCHFTGNGNFNKNQPEDTSFNINLQDLYDWQLTSDLYPKTMDLLGMPKGQCFQGDININIQRLVLNGKTFSEVKLPIKCLADGISVQPFRAMAHGGKLRGKLDLKYADIPRYTTEFNLYKADLNAIVGMMMSIPALEGKCDLSGSLKGTGTSWGPILSSLKGTVNLDMKSGNFKKSQILMGLRQTSSGPQEMGVYQALLGPKPLIPIGSLSSQLSFNQGVAIIDAFRISTPLVIANASGFINYNNKKMNINVLFSEAKQPKKREKYSVLLTGYFGKIKQAWSRATSAR